MKKSLLTLSLITLLLTIASLSINRARTGETIARREKLPADQIVSARNSLSLRPFLSSASIDENSSKIIAKNYGRLPLSFEANRGQADAQFDFLARGHGYQLGFNAHQAVIALANPSDRQAASSSVKMELVGADAQARSEAIDKLTGTSNYFIGNDPAKWRTNLPDYRSVKYHQIYPGIDILYYGKQQELEYDLIVQPGADAAAIKMRFTGMDKIDLDDDGNLLLKVAGGELYKHRPIIYQERQGARELIAGNYQLEDDGEVTINVSAYDHSRPLIIDPVLSYASFLGEAFTNSPPGIAVDSVGNLYITSSVTANFPTTSGTLQPAFAGGTTDVSVTKLNANGTALIYSTFLGGNGDDFGASLAVDNSGNVYVSGQTLSTNFPTTAGAFKTTLIGDTAANDGFVAKLNSSGTALIYATLLGGTGGDNVVSMAVDNSGNAYLLGASSTNDFPTTPGAFQTNYRGQFDCFVTKLNAAGSALVYSTYLGGSSNDLPAKLAIDSTGNAYIVGQTASTNFPTANPFQALFNGVFDGFVTKLNSSGTALIYSTYLGGSNLDGCSGVAVDAAGNTYVVGATRSTNYPTTAGAFQTQFGSGIGRVFVTKFNSAGTALSYSTLLGGSGNDVGNSIAIDQTGNAYITGSTTSTDFPTLNTFQSTFGGASSDLFVTKLNSTGSALIYSSYLGGSSIESNPNITLDSIGNAYISGVTLSADLPITPGAFQTTLVGSSPNLFIAKVVECATISVLPTTLPNGSINTIYSTQTITASGGVAPYTFAVTTGSLPAGLSLSSTGQLTGTPTAGGSFNFTITTTDTNRCTGTKSYTLTIITASCAPITISPTTLPNGMVGAGYNQIFTPSGGVAPYNFSVTSGSLPIGIPLTGGGVFSGTPRFGGTFNFTLTATDANGCTGSQSYTLVIDPANSTTTLSSSLNPATLGQPVTITAMVSPVPPATQTPTGTVTLFDGATSLGSMTLSSGRAMLTTASLTTGTHMITATYNGSADFNTSTSNTVMQLINCQGISIVPTTLPAALPNIAYSQQLTATGGSAPYSFTLQSGSLPAGFTLSSAGLLSGTTTQANNFNFVIMVTDANGCVGTISYTLSLCGDLSLTSIISTGKRTFPFNTQIQGRGGVPPYTFSLAGGVLPSGLRLASNGTISGTPTITGSFNFVVKLTDGRGCSAFRSYSLVISN